MDEQNVVYSHYGILFSHAKNELLIHDTAWMDLEDLLSERSKTQKAKHRTIPFIGSIQNRQISRAEKLVSGCLGLGGRRWEWFLTDTGFLFRVIKMFQSWLWCSLHSSEDRWKPNELNTLTNKLHGMNYMWNRSVTRRKNEMNKKQIGGVNRDESRHRWIKQ